MLKNQILIPVALFLALTFTGIQGFAQISERSQPYTTRNHIVNDNFPVIKVNAPDVEKLKEEDAFTDKYGIAMRFAEAVPVNIDLAEQGRWMNLIDGSRICRLAVTSEGAQALIMYYSDFRIPDDGKLFLYSENKKQTAGAFTSFNNRDGGVFATEMIYGETTILEYHQPAGSSELPKIVIHEAGYVYRTADRIFGTRGFGNSDSCEVNVKCVEGTDWANQANGVARIIVKAGTSSLWCTGSLVNNTRQDHAPYFLTADHCGANASAEDYDNWIFYFRYQGDQCGNPANDFGFNFYTMVGATKVASAGGAGVESDFKLLLLNESVPLDYNPFYNGWSTLDEPSPDGVTIHHPQGDIKKISTYTQPLVSTNWSTIPNTHWRVIWAATETNHGVTEGGSSGSPIFGSSGLIMGQLTGGEASCIEQNSPDYYGKFSYSWDQIGDTDTTKLKPWLDPGNTGVETLTGLVKINEPETKTTHYRIYPNPTTGVTFLDTGNNDPSAINEISVIDLTGRVLLRMKPLAGINPVVLDLSGMEKGVYFVLINTEGKKVTSLKLIR